MLAAPLGEADRHVSAMLFEAGVVRRRGAAAKIARSERGPSQSLELAERVGGVTTASLAIAWPCRLSVADYAAAGKRIDVPAQACAELRCAARLMAWSGYRRWLRDGGSTRSGSGVLAARRAG